MEILRATIILGFLFLIQASHSFPRVVSIVTTRDVASRYGDKWDIRHKLSKRQRDISEESVQLHVIVHSETDLAQLDQEQAAGVLTYREVEEQHERSLEEEEEEDWEEDFYCYRTVAETYDSMEGLAYQYPGLISLDTIGQSYLKQQNEEEGYDIKIMIIGANASAVTEKADMMIVGGQHSRELPPPESLMRWVEHLLGNYGIEPDITWILNRTNIHIIPIANPDGRQIVQDNLAWNYRKNAHPNDCDEGPEGYGVDLNRNYPMFYGDDEGSSPDYCSINYRGTEPLSEPEASAVYHYARALFANDIKKGTSEDAEDRREEACPTNATGMFIDVHSNGDYIYFPWGYEDEPSPNHLPLLTMAAKLAKPGDYELWGPGQDGFQYFVSGSAQDSIYGMECVFTQGYELGSKQYARCEEMEDSIVPIVFESLLYAAKCASAPYILPRGPDILSIEVNSTEPKNVTFVVEVSDEALIVEHAKFDDEDDRSQPIDIVLVFVDTHPYDSAGEGSLMAPQDGAFDDVDEVATVSLDLSMFEGVHVLYFQASDQAGFSGPASAVWIDLPKASSETTVGGGSEEFELPGPGESSSQVELTVTVGRGGHEESKTDGVDKGAGEEKTRSGTGMTEEAKRTGIEASSAADTKTAVACPTPGSLLAALGVGLALYAL